MLVRDAEDQGSGARLEVCMLRRHLDSDFVGGAYVFPGGKVDDEDRSAEAGEVCAGRDDRQASAMLGIDSGALAFWIAALRECFEEAGVLVARLRPSADDDVADAARGDAEARPGGSTSPTATASWPGLESTARLEALRRALNAGEIGFVEACRRDGLELAVDRVHYFSHWITPEPAPKRYDTRFFVAALPPGQVPIHDDYETTDTVWVRPDDALARARAGEFDLIFPTMKNLEAISRFTTSGELLAAAAAIETVPTVLPRVVADQRGVRILLPGDPGYEEAVSPPARPAGSMTPAEMGAVVRSIGQDGTSRPPA